MNVGPLCHQVELHILETEQKGSQGRNNHCNEKKDSFKSSRQGQNICSDSLSPPEAQGGITGGMGPVLAG